jgi:hypothetical protein
VRDTGTATSSLHAVNSNAGTTTAIRVIAAILSITAVTFLGLPARLGCTRAGIYRDLVREETAGPCQDHDA